MSKFTLFFTVFTVFHNMELCYMYKTVYFTKIRVFGKNLRNPKNPCYLLSYFRDIPSMSGRNPVETGFLGYVPYTAFGIIGFHRFDTFDTFPSTDDDPETAIPRCYNVQGSLQHPRTHGFGQGLKDLNMLNIRSECPKP